MDLFENLTIKHPWIVSSFKRTLESNKSLKSVSFLVNKKTVWIKDKGGKTDEDSKIVNEITLGSMDKLWECTFENFYGPIEEIQLEGGQNRIFFKKLAPNVWMNTVSNIFESHSQLVQDFITNSLETMIKLEDFHENQFIGIITSEGFNLWLKSKLPVFVLEDALTSYLTALERLQLELKLGSIEYSSIYTDSDFSIHTLMSANNELAIAFDNKTIYDKLIDDFFRDIYRSSQTINVPEALVEQIKTFQESKNENPLLEEMRATPIESEISEDEMLSLIGFDEALLERMEKTIHAIVTSYNIKEISIPYLGQKIFRLPSIVIQLSLSYLIGQGRILGAKLKFSSSEQLVPDVLEVDYFTLTEQDKKFLKNVSAYKFELLKEVREYLDVLEQYQHTKPTSNVFNELEAVRQSTDSYPLISLSRDILALITGIKERLTVLDKKTGEEREKIDEKIKMDSESLRMKIVNLKNDLISLNNVLYRFLPLPKEIKQNNTHFSLIFSCSSKDCTKKTTISVDQSIEAWRKFLLYIPSKKQSSSIKEFISPLKKIFLLLKTDSIEKILSQTSLNLDQIIITNEERELLIDNISNLKLAKIVSGQCDICENWFCNSHIDENQLRCSDHKKLSNV